jgi:uncharacterized membrane protein YdjX (TVP38/TMEM64 family)
MLRLSPVLPDSLMNYAMSLIGSLPFMVFAAATAVAMVPWVLLYVYLGSASKVRCERCEQGSCCTSALGPRAR